MYFVKRDFVLLAGTILLTIGLIPFLAPAYAIAVGVVVFFGIKGFVQMRKKSIEKEIGEGFCAQCGDKIVNKKCPNCDEDKEKN